MRRDERRASTIRASAGKQNPVGKKTRACREQLAGFASRVRRDCDRVYNDWGGKKGRRERERADRDVRVGFSVGAVTRSLAFCLARIYVLYIMR